ncbi:hemerythrin domain-containing protein [Telmatospirillum sp. J64-1]|uniref:hemerythrin domain-containing protein n=1 Tax=Telmatospirillum sp. J64-1 TaxID=2502183 RepID=UPI00115EF505|nr:hemerythrin domain-containing protein [Telmatospirillum sp. J64-1]
MASTILHMLEEEHRTLGRVLRLMRRQLDRLARDGDADFEMLGEIAHYIRNYPDLFHHPKEDLVFRRLRLRDAGAAAVVERLLEEHRHVAGMTDDLSRLIDEARVQPGRRPALQAAAEAYIDFQQRHMECENTDALPRAQAALLPGDWEEIAGLVEGEEDPLMSKAGLGQYSRLRDRIFAGH